MANHNPPTNGFDKRKHQINRKGRPKDFDGLRTLAKVIADEKIISKDGAVAMSRVELILRNWAASGNHQLQRAFIEICYGKVPDAVDITSGGKPIVVKSIGVDVDKL